MKEIRLGADMTMLLAMYYVIFIVVLNWSVGCTHFELKLKNLSVEEMEFILTDSNYLSPQWKNPKKCYTVLYNSRKRGSGLPCFICHFDFWDTCQNCLYCKGWDMDGYFPYQWKTTISRKRQHLIQKKRGWEERNKGQDNIKDMEKTL